MEVLIGILMLSPFLTAGYWCHVLRKKEVLSKDMVYDYAMFVLLLGVSAFFLGFRYLHPEKDITYVILNTIDRFTSLLIAPVVYLLFNSLSVHKRIRHKHILFATALLVPLTNLVLLFFAGDLQQASDIMKGWNSSQFVIPSNFSEWWRFVNTNLFYSFLLVQLFWVALITERKKRQFRSQLGNFYAYLKNTNYVHLSRIFSCIIVLILMEYLTLVLKHSSMSHYELWIFSLLAVFQIAIWVIGREIYAIQAQLYPVLSENDVPTEAENKLFGETIDKLRKQIREERNINVEQRIEKTTFLVENPILESDEINNVQIAQQLKNWAERSDKPFLQLSLTVKQLADELQITPYMLSTYLNMVLDTNFNGWVNSLRIKESMRLMLEFPKMPMSEVSDKSGFSDPCVFSRVFRRTMGMTPRDYRKEGGQK